MVRVRGVCESAHLEEEVDDGEDDVLGDELGAAQDALAAQRRACRRRSEGWARQAPTGAMGAAGAAGA